MISDRKSKTIQALINHLPTTIKSGRIGIKLAFPSILLLTNETMITLLSLPWYLSTVLTSTVLEDSFAKEVEITFN